MNSKYKIDILLPTYNGAKFLNAQIDSILNQSISDFQLLVRDDGSKDLTLEIIEQYAINDDRVILIESSEGNIGLVNSIEKLLSYSNADLIFFSDQDDVWFNNKIELFLERYNKISKKNTPILIHSDCYITDEELKVKGVFIGEKAKKIGNEDSLFNFFVQGASTMINNKLKEIVVEFPTNVYVHDRYFHIMAQLFGKRLYIETPTMYYRQHNNNLIGTGSIYSKIKNNLKFRKFYLPEEKLLMNSLLEKFPSNNYLLLYKVLTSNSSRMEKIKLLKKNKIILSLKQYFFLFIKN
ncbi:glycosyltransferase family 2 protein [Empedobacter sp.]|uniref:glycosyltransferase family 2 protein n=1 Tax=Empedobacter sp. TaxID=1927715 RepID=UPI00289E489E|nr:glycosyltransferase family 2 protein [Empedobacter sp.]